MTPEQRLRRCEINIYWICATLVLHACMLLWLAGEVWP